MLNVTSLFVRYLSFPAIFHTYTLHILNKRECQIFITENQNQNQTRVHDGRRLLDKLIYIELY